MVAKGRATNTIAGDIPATSLTPAATVNDEQPAMSDEKQTKNSLSAWQALKILFTASFVESPSPTTISSVTNAPIKEVTIDPVTIIALISAILPMIQKCREDDRPPTDEELLRVSRGAQGVFAIRRGLRAQGLRGRKFRVAARQAVDELKNMSDNDLMEQVIHAPEMEEDDEGHDGIDYQLFK